MRTIFIGDVHGCAEELDLLLRACGHAPDDRVVLLGDLVAKGPDSVGVLARVRALGLRGVLGNHDAHVLAARGGSLPSGKRLKPHHQAVVDALGDADWALLAALPLYLRLPELGVLAVHAGLVPGVPLAQQSPTWLLNLRSLGPDGRPSKRLDGVAWGSRWTGPERVLHGHDALRGLQRHPHALGLDTGCVYGGKLSAWVEAPGEPGRLVQVDARRAWAAGEG